MKYSHWLQNHNWENCKLGRKTTGIFLANYLSEESDGFVLSLNGKWGTGKTEFLKRMYVEFGLRGHPVIYINAWESDFTDNPLEVIAYELLDQLQGLEIGDADGLKEIKSNVGKFLKRSAVVGAGLVAKKMGLEADDGRWLIEQFVDVKPEDATDFASKNYKEQIKNLSNIRKSISKFVDSLSMLGVHAPVFVLIDELDRCRPDYAVEMLEVVKHFFETKGLVFVIANDTKQLEASIKVLYGSEFDSSVYLRRFFSRTANLPVPDMLSYINQKDVDFRRYDEICYDGIVEEYTFSHVINWVSDCFNLKVRDVDQVIAKLHGILRQANYDSKLNRKKPFLSFLLLAFMVAEHHENMTTYFSRDNIYQDNCNILNGSGYSPQNVKIDDFNLYDLLLLNFVFYSLYKHIFSDGLNRGNVVYRIAESGLIDERTRSGGGLGKISSRLFYEFQNKLKCISVVVPTNAKTYVAENSSEVWLIAQYREYIELSGVLS